MAHVLGTLPPSVIAGDGTEMSIQLIILAWERRVQALKLRLNENVDYFRFLFYIETVLHSQNLTNSPEGARDVQVGRVQQHTLDGSPIRRTRRKGHDIHIGAAQ